MSTKTKKPARSVRYLLRADQRLRKISLRKMAEPAEKAKQAVRSHRSKHPGSATHPVAFPWTISSRAMAIGVICIVAAAVLMAARPPSQTVDAAIVAPPPAATESRDAVPAAPRLRPQKTVISKVPVDAAAKTSAPRTALPKSAPVERVNVAAVKPPVTKPAVEPATSKPVVAAMATRPVVEPAPTARAAESPARADVEDSTSVTITGCLELDNGTFILKNTSGAEAPKSRSWKSGFLRKRSATIDLVDPADGLRLTRHVGQRVAATGTLTGREMRARALRRVAGSCN